MNVCQCTVSRGGRQGGGEEGRKAEKLGDQYREMEQLCELGTLFVT